MEIKWGDYADAFKAIFESAETIISVCSEVTKIEYTYEGTGADKVVKTKKFYKGETLLFTLTYNYDADLDVMSIVRS